MVRQKLDDNVPEPLPERRDLLTRVVVSAARANRELDAQTASFHQMRDLVFNAPERLDALTQQLVTVTARIEPSSRSSRRCAGSSTRPRWRRCRLNVNAARERLEFADKAITRAGSWPPPVAGEVGELVDCVRGGESALQQANKMLDAVDSAASDINRAVATLPRRSRDIQRGINQASEQLAQGGLSKAGELSAARDAAVKPSRPRRATAPPTRWARSRS